MTQDFFYNQKNSTTYCFNCLLGIKNWNSRAIPWAIHALASPICPFLVTSQTPDFIAAVQRQRHDIILNMIPKDEETELAMDIANLQNELLHQDLFQYIYVEQFNIIDHTIANILALPLPNPVTETQTRMESIPEFPDNNIALDFLNLDTQLIEQMISDLPNDIDEYISVPTITHLNPHSPQYDNLTDNWIFDPLQSDKPSSSRTSPPPLSSNKIVYSQAIKFQYPLTEHDLFIILYEINYHRHHLDEMYSTLEISKQAEDFYELTDIKIRNVFKLLINQITQVPFNTPNRNFIIYSPFEWYQKCFISIKGKPEPSEISISDHWKILNKNQKSKYELLAHNDNVRSEVKRLLQILSHAGFYVTKTYNNYFYELTTNPAVSLTPDLINFFYSHVNEKLKSIINTPHYAQEFKFPPYQR